MNLEQLFSRYKEQTLKGRYITLDSIEPLLQKISTQNQIEIIGKSVLEKPIYKYQIGKGKIRILLWSQMHGNESTTTKALFDFFNLINSDTDYAKQLMSKFTFCILPMLNPDGAKLYTRENANGVDLNRDAQDLSQPESVILRKTFEVFKPNFCYNLHDQRTIYGVGDTRKPATLSFLAPAFNEERDINESRLKAVNLIAGINSIVQHYIPGQIGRFDDSFNFNCVGDTFQFLGVPTVLFEAGHFANDYDRDQTRKFIFFALISSFNILIDNDIVISKIEDYLIIPQNKVVFYDFMYKNIKIYYDGIEKITSFAAQYKEELIENNLFFNAYIDKIDNLENYFGHIEYDGMGSLYSDQDGNFPKLESKANFNLDTELKFENGLKI